MTPDVSIVVPAYRAHATIAGAVASALAQTHTHFEIVLVSDDGTDYRQFLADQAIADERLRFATTGARGTGSSNARNVGLDHARARFVAILDADDRLHPEKLAHALPAAERYGMVSTALAVTDADGHVLRTVAAGPDTTLAPAAYKFTNLSMDSMLVYDRGRADPRYDPTLECLTDLDLVLKLFASLDACRHLGTPLHSYVKQPVSISNGPGVAARMIRTKTLMLDRLANGHYPLADPEARGGFERFLTLSRHAEETFAPDPAQPGPPLFEDHIEPILATGRASAIWDSHKP